MSGTAVRGDGDRDSARRDRDSGRRDLLDRDVRRSRLSLLVLLAILLAAAPAAGAAPPRPGPGAPALERTREPVARPTASPPRATASARLSRAALKSALRGPMRSAGRSSGASVVDFTSGRVLFRSRSGTRRSPASVEKLYTTGTALLRFGPDATLSTRVVGDGQLEGDTFTGDLYLVGAGDPTFGSLSFTRRSYGAGATTFALAQALAAKGIRRVEGRILGDDSVFDGFRGVPDSGLRSVSPYVGPLSGLSYDRGGSASFAASQLKVALKAQGVSVSGSTGAGTATAGLDELASVASPPLRTIVRLTNQPSDNFFAETLIKGLGARFGGGGSTAQGAGVVRSTVARYGIRPTVVDGSGLSRTDHTSPSQLVTFLDGMRREAAFDAFKASLPVAGRSGTLYSRMRGTAAQDRCSAKTGTLSNVSALAGYCQSTGGELVGFALLMNGVSVSGARSLQDRMVTAIARYDAG